MARKFLTAALLSGSLILTACNTIAGAGRDVQSVGETVAECAEGQTC